MLAFVVAGRTKCQISFFSPRRGFPGVLKFCMYKNNKIHTEQIILNWNFYYLWVGGILGLVIMYQMNMWSILNEHFFGGGIGADVYIPLVVNNLFIVRFYLWTPASPKKELFC